MVGRGRAYWYPLCLLVLSVTLLVLTRAIAASEEHHCLLGFRMRRLYFSVISFFGFCLGRPAWPTGGFRAGGSSFIAPTVSILVGQWLGRGEALRAGEVPRYSLIETLL